MSAVVPPLVLLATNAVRSALDDLHGALQAACGALSFRYDTSAMILARVRAGERPHAVIATDAVIAALASCGLADGGSRLALARSRLGMAVRAGAPHPDISDVPAFARALRSAASVAYTSGGASGIHFAKVIDRIGVGDEVRGKAHIEAGGLIGEAIARGDAEVAVQMISELLAVPGIDLVGPLPEPLQEDTLLCAAVLDGERVAAARRVLHVLRGETATAALARRGLDPVPR